MANTLGQSDWVFEIRDSDGTSPVRIIGARKRQLSLVLNQAGEAMFELDLDDTKALETNLREGRSQLYVYRNDTLLWSGIIMIVERIMEQTNSYARIRALGWYWFLSKRFVGIDADDVHTSEDAGAIAWDLINQTQLETYGDLGITQGEIDTSNNLTITYTRQNIKDAIDDLILSGGIDIEITPNKVFNVHYPIRGTDRSETVVFKYPGNVSRLRFVKDATTIVNSENILGQGVGDEEISAQRDDVGSQSIYNLFEKISSYKEIDNVTVLGNIAAFDILLLKSPRNSIEMRVKGNGSVPDLSNYNVGDLVRTKVVKNNFTSNNVYRIFQIDISIDEADRENINIVAALV